MNLIDQTTAILLVGGRGTRIQGHFPDLPKPLVPAADRPFLYWIMSWLAAQGVHHMVLSTGYLAEKIDAWAKSGDVPKNLLIDTCLEESALGTGGGALNCLSLARDPVLILNGDSLLATSIQPLFDALADPQIDAAILANSVDDTSRFGSLDINSDGFLLGFHEKRAGAGSINAGVYLFRRRVLEVFPVGENLSMEYDVLPTLLRQHARIKVCDTKDAPFLDIGTPETVAQASHFIQANASLIKSPK